MSAPPPTPTLDKRATVIDDSHKIGDFLDWLSEQGIVLGRWSHEVYSRERQFAPERFRGKDWWDLPDPKPSYREWLHEEIEFPGTEDRVIPIGEGPDALLHRYFEIDPVAEENEKRALLDYIRGNT